MGAFALDVDGDGISDVVEHANTAKEQIMELTAGVEKGHMVRLLLAMVVVVVVVVSVTISVLRLVLVLLNCWLVCFESMHPPPFLDLHVVLFPLQVMVLKDREMQQLQADLAAQVCTPFPSKQHTC